MGQEQKENAQQQKEDFQQESLLDNDSEASNNEEPELSDDLDESSDSEEGNDPDKSGDEQDGDDEIVVTIGEKEPDSGDKEKAPEWVRDLRKAHRELSKENRSLKQKLESLNSPKKVESLRKKPTLEDHDYDTEKYESDLLAWSKEKEVVETKQKEEEENLNKAKEEWEKKLSNYDNSVKELKVKDYEEAEEVILQNFSQDQQSIVIAGSKNPALLMYAIGKNPDKAKELAQIKNSVEFIWEVAKLEKEINVRPKKPKTQPEKVPSSSSGSSTSGSVDTKLEKLRKEAERTGDYTKVTKYKRALKSQKK